MAPNRCFSRSRIPLPLVLAGLLSLLLIGACASGGAEGRERRSANLISAEELADAPTMGDAWEVIELLRPNWLRGRGGRGATPVVFINGQRFGDLSSLRGLPTADLESVRYINARDATVRYGTGYPGGIIDLRTRRR